MAPGGIGTYVSHISHLLAAAGETVHVVGQRWQEAPLAVEEKERGRLIIHRVPLVDPVPVSRNQTDIWTAQREVAELARVDHGSLCFAWQAGLLAEKLVMDEAIDLIEAQDFSAPLYFFQLRRALGLGPAPKPPCIVHLHSPREFIVHHDNLDIGDPFYVNAPRYEAYTIGAADALICPSRFMAREAEGHFGIEAGTIESIPLPCGQTPVLHREDSVWRSGTILYVGRLEARKGVIEWVEAAVAVAREYPDTRFTLIGANLPYSDNISVKEYLLTRIPLHMRQRFRFLGSLSQSELLSHLAEARIVAVPSRWENFPNTCVEAMCTGLPVLASPNGGMVEMIEDGRTGWLASNSDPAALENALRRALSTPPSRLAEMGHAASKSIRELCDNSTIVQRHINYRKSVALRGATASLRLPVNLPWPRRPLRECNSLRHQPSGGAGIAVIITCTEGGAMLPDALKSLMTQATAPAAVVLAATEEVDEEIQQALTMACHQGVTVVRAGRTAAEAKNAAINLILTEQGRPLAFAFIDIKDRLYPAFLESCESALRSCNEVGIVSTWNLLKGAEDGFIANPCPSFPYQFLSDDVGPTLVVRTKALESAGLFRPTFDLGYDTWDLANAVMAAGWVGVTFPGLLFEHHKVASLNPIPSAVQSRMAKEELFSRIPLLSTREATELAAILEARFRKAVSMSKGLFSRIPLLSTREATELAVILEARLRKVERKARNFVNHQSSGAMFEGRRVLPVGPAMVREGPLVSVVICTHQRAAHLCNALWSLLEQGNPGFDFEVIVVDNCSTDDTAEVVRSFQKQGNVRYQFEKALGLCKARNRGWRAARGRYVAYLDDDALAQPGWLKAIPAAFEVHPNCGALGGRTDPIWEGERPEWLSDGIARSLTIIGWDKIARPISDLDREWLVGANIVIPREVLAEVGGFHPLLDRMGSRMLSSGDVFLQKAIARRGYQCIYDPALFVHHLVPVKRLEKRWFVKRFFWQGISNAVIRLIEERPSWPRRLHWGLREMTRMLSQPKTLAHILRRPNDPEQFEATCLKWLEVGKTLGFLAVARSSRPQIRVRLLRTLYPHWGNHSGINQFLAHLDRSRYEITEKLVADSDEAFPIRNDALRNRVRRLIRRSGMPWYKLSDLDAELRALRHCLLGRVDVLHYLDGEHTAMLLPWLREQWGRPRPKLLATFHQPPEILAEILDRKIVSQLDHVTLVSPTQEEYFLEFMPREKLTTILHGVDVDFFTPPRSRPVGERFRCIIAGHWLRDWKAIRRVALELSSNWDVEFHVLTNRETGLEELHNVTMHRNVSDEDLVALYQEADALFLPLTKPTATNTLLEGMACGLPIISTRTPAVEAYVPKEAGILVEENSPDELIDALLTFKRDPQRRVAAGQRARARAETLNWSIVARGYSEIYAMLASEP